MISSSIRVLVPLIALVLDGVALAQHSPATSQRSANGVAVPKSWNDVGLSEWATPLADVNLRPGNFTEAELDQVPVYELYRSYPAYYPGREPAGYWKWLQSRKPELLIKGAALRTEDDWTKAGQRVFREMYFPPPEPQDKLIELVRSREALERARVHPNPDGTIPPRWVVTPSGIRIAPSNCQACHSRVLADGTRVDGIPIVNDPGAVLARLRESLDIIRQQRRRGHGAPAETAAWPVWHALAEGRHTRTFHDDELGGLRELGSVARRRVHKGRWKPVFPVKIPDLIGLKDRKYIDHTATHRHRGIEDLMRYATLITCCFSGGIGRERKFAVAEALPGYRFSDELLYALALYIYSLEPPRNPNPRSRYRRPRQGRFHA